MTSLIAAEQLSLGYSAGPVVRDLDLHVDAGEIVLLIGANGAGKTTTLMGLSGVLKPMSGRTLMHGTVTTAPLYKRARRGLSVVTETRSTFMRLSAADNLHVGRAQMESALELFPELKPLLRNKAGLLSGGEQQMLSLARALARSPSILLADELSLGLAPLIVDRLLRAVRAAADRGVGVLLVEQHVSKALRVTDRAYVMRKGAIVLAGTAADLHDRMHEIEATYLSSDELEPQNSKSATDVPSGGADD